MIGRNLGRTLPKRAKKGQRSDSSDTDSSRSPPETKTDQEPGSQQSPAKPKPKGKRACKKQPTPPSNGTEQLSHYQAHVIASNMLPFAVLAGAHMSLPTKVGTDLSLIQFADASVEPSTVLVVLRFSSIAKRALYTLEPVIHFDKPDRRWLEPVAHDPVFLHTMISTTEDYFMVLTGTGAHGTSSPNPRATGREFAHLLKALGLLRERLIQADPEEALSDDTICVILCIATTARGFGDYEAEFSHMKGLRKIVDLRGGVEGLRGSGKLLIDLFRCDLGIAFDTGRPPTFFHNDSESFIPYPTTPLTSLFPSNRLSTLPTELKTPSHLSNLILRSFIPTISPSLVEAWTSLSNFCTAINMAHSLNQRLPKEYMLDTMASVMYRLISFGLSSPSLFALDSLDELVRIGLLVFSANVFLPWLDLKLPFTYLPYLYRGVLQRGKPERCPSELWTWLLFIGGIAVCNGRDELLAHELVKALGDSGLGENREEWEWEDVRGLLRGIIEGDY